MPDNDPQAADASARKAIGARLREARAAAEMDQQEVADLLGVHTRTIREWENGKTSPPADKLRKVLIRFGVSAQYVLGLSPHRTGLPIGDWIVDKLGLERVEAARSSKEVSALWEEAGLLLGYKIPQEPRVVSGETFDEIKRRIADASTRLFPEDGNASVDGSPSRG